MPLPCTYRSGNLGRRENVPCFSERSDRILGEANPINSQLFHNPTLLFPPCETPRRTRGPGVLHSERMDDAELNRLLSGGGGISPGSDDRFSAFSTIEIPLSAKEIAEMDFMHRLIHNEMIESTKTGNVQLQPKKRKRPAAPPRRVVRRVPRAKRPGKRSAHTTCPPRSALTAHPGLMTALRSRPRNASKRPTFESKETRNTLMEKWGWWVEKRANGPRKFQYYFHFPLAPGTKPGAKRARALDSWAKVLRYLDV